MHFIIHLQKIMALVLSLCFYAHDIHYVNKFIGMDFTSFSFLVSLLFFHLIIYLKEAGYVQIKCPNEEKKTGYLKILITSLCIICYILGDDGMKNLIEKNIFEFHKLANLAVAIFIIVFPEMVFRIIFSVKPN